MVPRYLPVIAILASLAASQPMQPELVNMEVPIVVVPGQRSYVECGEGFSLMNRALPDSWFTSIRGALKRTAASLSDKDDTTFYFRCVKQQQPGQSVFIRYGDTVQLQNFKHQVLTWVSKDGTLTFGECANCNVILTNPDNKMDTSGPLGPVVGFTRESDGAWLTMVRGNDESVLWMNGVPDDFVTFELTTHRVAPIKPPAKSSAEIKAALEAAAAEEAKKKAAAGPEAGTIVSGTKPPGPPEALSIVMLKGTSGELTWTEPKDKGDTPISSYRVYRCDDPSCTERRMLVADKNVLSALTSDNSPDREYFYRVRAVNAAGAGAASEPLKVMFKGPEPAAGSAEVVVSVGASAASDEVPLFCTKFCSGSCGFTCRTNCPKLCLDEEVPEELCVAQCSEKCSPACGRLCPKVCPIVRK